MKLMKIYIKANSAAIENESTTNQERRSKILQLNYLFPQLQHLQIACDAHTNNHVTSLKSVALKLNYGHMKVSSYKSIPSLSAMI